MKTLANVNVREELYERIATLAKVRGKTVSEVAADFIAQAIASDDEAEAQLLAEVRAEREELARRGFWTTPEEVQAAKVRGRK